MSHAELLQHAKAHVRRATANAFAWILGSPQFARHQRTPAHLNDLCSSVVANHSLSLRNVLGRALDKLCAMFQQSDSDETQTQLVELFGQLGTNL